MTTNPRDTRKFPRTGLEVPVLVSDAAKKVRKPIRFSSADVSGGGTFLRSDLLFEVGEVLHLEFDLPNGHHIGADGRVVRVARGEALRRSLYLLSHRCDLFAGASRAAPCIGRS